MRAYLVRGFALLAACVSTVPGLPAQGPLPPAIWELLRSQPRIAGAAPRGDLVRMEPEIVSHLRSGDVFRVEFSAAPGVTAVVEEATETVLGSHVRTGRLMGQPDSHFTLVQRGAAVAGLIEIDRSHRYLVSGDGEPGSLVRVEPAIVPGGPACACGTEGMAFPPRLRGRSSPHARPRAADPVMLNEGPAEFDLLIVYTPAALHTMGSSAGVEAQAELALADANACYANSGVALHGRLVGVRGVNYVESGAIRTDLRHLDQPDDGVMDEVVDWRDELGADFVCLFTSHPSVDGFRGYALILQELIPDYEQSAYSVVDVRAATVEHLLAHELGHNMGCDHDLENTTGLHLFSDSYGWRFTGNDGVLYRDVMAYAPGQSIAFFSSPDVFYQGTPTGAVGLANTAGTLRAAAPLFTHFREPNGRGLASVTATVTETSVQTGAMPGEFTVARTGSGRQPVTLLYALSGTAANGTDFAALPGAVTIPADDYAATIPVQPLPALGHFGLKTITVTLLPGEGYEASAGADTATVTLFDKKPVVAFLDDSPGLTAALGRPARLVVQRLGRLDAPLTVRFTVGGSARASVDYRDLGENVLVFPAGVASAKLKVKVLPGLTTGRDVALTLAKDPAYHLDPNAGAATITLEGSP